MKSTEIVGNYQYSFNETIQLLENKKGTDITTSFGYWDMSNSAYMDIYNQWQTAKFNSNSIKWTNYYPTKDFDENIVNNVCNQLNLKGLHRSWISRIDPGYYAPWHWDVDDNESKYLELGEIKRYSIIMHPPTLGHILIVGDDYLFNMIEGSIIKWNNHREWHAGINAGLTPNYMLHILGY